MRAPQRFKISTALKDIIGRDLITNDFVAIFELVKNSFDAHATRVDLIFDNDRIWIIDDGKGMTRGDVVDKWLFVAYSAKKSGEEDRDLPSDYRDRISQRRGYAGNKGIGRFSCDRLGTKLHLYTKPVARKDGVERLIVDWLSFERDAKEEFASVEINLSRIASFPDFPGSLKALAHGTVLEIGGLRSPWPRDKLLRLKDYLAKLVNPFGSREDMSIAVHVPRELAEDRSTRGAKVNGKVGNDIVDVLETKTTKISVEMQEGGLTRSQLTDRGRLIYSIEEQSPYEALYPARIKFELFFLNRSAKATFTRAMGVESVNFGNVFLFLNGFRVFPIGEADDDTFGLDKRKGQGFARYLGTRDILGRIDVDAPIGFLRETSSRDAGLIDDSAAQALKEALIRLVLTRLEKYVVDVTWADRLDTDRSDTSGLTSDSARARIVEVVRLLVGSKRVTLLDYDRRLVDTISERASEFERTMQGLALVASKTGDRRLLDRIEQSRKRYEALRKAEQEAREKAEAEAKARAEAEAVAEEALERADQAEYRLEEEKKRSSLLASLQDRDSETLTLLHHQAVIYATAIQDIVANNLLAINQGAPPSIEEIAADLEQISFQNSRIMAVTRFATQANFRMNADKTTADIVQYIDEYIERISTLFEGKDFASCSVNGQEFETTFRPIDIAIVVDNLISNAKRAKASFVKFEFRNAKGEGVELVVTDDGRGFDTRKVDTSRLFEKGYSSTDGSGLGLYHVTQVLNEMGGAIRVLENGERAGASFLIHIGKPKARSRR
ncbi:MAG: ATP-binding protein [Pseudomonadota bacterium]